ncbi:MAG: methylmalonyl-CoA epimerase [Armatimonadetes bacterium]|nr:methylmalonyl-CoA epimerase [Armatimonadota bacterium]
MLKNLDHIGIVVEDLDAAVAQYTAVFGFSLHEVTDQRAQGMRIASLRLGELVVELMESTSPEGVLAAFREKRGTGVHHLAYRVSDIHGDLRLLQERGIKAIDNEPRRGGGGNLIAFLHPKDTGGVLMELCQPERGATP